MKKHILILFYTVLFFLSAKSQTWQQLDSLCYELGAEKPDSAILIGKKAIEGCIKEKGESSIEYAVCLDHIAWAYKTKNQFNIADSLYNSAKNTLTKIQKTKTAEYSEILNNHATIYEEKGKYKEAEALYNEVKSIRAEILGKMHPDYALVCNNLGVLFLRQGMYSAAEPLLKESVKIQAKTQGKKTFDYVQACTNLATSAMYQGKISEAEILFTESKTILTEVLGKQNMEYIMLCNNLALLYRQQKRHKEAETLYHEGIEILDKLMGKNNIYYATSCSNLGSVYLSMGNFAKTEEFYKKAHETNEKLLGKENPATLFIYNNLGVLYGEQEENEKAYSLLKHVFDTRIKVLGTKHPDFAASCYQLARVYMKKNNFQDAESLFKQMMSVKWYEIHNNFKSLSEEEKQQYFNNNIDMYINVFHVFVQNRYAQNPLLAGDSYNLVLETKGMILQSTEKIKNRILASQDETLKKKYIDWKNIKDVYAKAQNVTIEQQKKINIDSLARVVNDLEKELALKSEDFASVFVSKIVTWKDIQNSLKKDQAAIEILRINAKKIKFNAKDSIVYMILILKKDSYSPEIISFINGNELENTYITNYRRSVANKITDDKSYTVFWKPIAEHLKGIKTVYFSPDGVYHQINLNTLQNPQTKKYVFDEVQIINVTNTKDILEKKKFTSKNNYLIGNPKFDLQINPEQNNEKPKQERTFEGFFEGVSQLEGAEKEVKQISAILPSAKTTVGTDATEEYIKSIKNPRILHIATHGYFKKGQYQTSTQAMLNAGLLFAGVVDYDRMDIRPLDKEDGKLTAFEVMNMELDSTELVVLSACETGLGQASKEGVYGLQRAFKVAGAQTIIMSLWKVNDEATQLLMTKFYENWQKKGMDKRKAFETAQKELRKQYREPYYWGAFLMIE